MKTLGIIPARGGSKRLPQKNIRPLFGKPLIAWTIEIAKQSGLDRVIVSTDNQEIADIAKEFGAEVPFIRPEHLATDTIGIEDVLKHAYEWMRDKEQFDAEAIVLLLATSPTRQVVHIQNAMNLFEESQSDSVVTVVPALANWNPHWQLVEDPNRGVILFTGEHITQIRTRSQDLPPTWSRNDVAYVLKPSNLYQEKPNLYGDRIQLSPMNDFYNADVNTENDWFITEQKIKLMQEGKAP